MPSRVRAIASAGFRRTAERSSSIAGGRLSEAFEREAEVVARLGVAGWSVTAAGSAGSAPARSRVHQRVAPR